MRRSVAILMMTWVLVALCGLTLNANASCLEDYHSCLRHAAALLDDCVNGDYWHDVGCSVNQSIMEMHCIADDVGCIIT